MKVDETLSIFLLTELGMLGRGLKTRRKESYLRRGGKIRDGRNITIGSCVNDGDFELLLQQYCSSQSISKSRYKRSYHSSTKYPAAQNIKHFQKYI